jgi:hypothetical protein
MIACQNSGLLAVPVTFHHLATAALPDTDKKSRRLTGAARPGFAAKTPLKCAILGSGPLMNTACKGR